MKLFRFILLLPLSALALEPGTPAYGPNGLAYPNGLPAKVSWNTDVSGHYGHATEIHARDGVRPLSDFVQVTNTTETVVSVPVPMQDVGKMYAKGIQQLAGQGAHTNQALEKPDLELTLALNTNITAETGYRLEKLHEQIVRWNSENGLQDKAWAFPFGQGSITNTTTTIEWEPVE